MKFLSLSSHKPPQGSIAWALSRVIGSRRTSRILKYTPPHRALEEAAHSLRFDLRTLVARVADELGIRGAFDLVTPTHDTILQTGFSADELRGWRVLPQSTRAPAGYSLVIADSGLVSVDEFEAQGVVVALAPGSEVEACWKRYFERENRKAVEVHAESTESTSAESSHEHPATIEDVSPFADGELEAFLTAFALECSALGGKHAILQNGSRSMYEFAGNGSRYSGTVEPEFLSSLKRFIRPNSRFAMSAPQHGIRRLTLERRGDSECESGETSFRLSWSSGSDSPEAARLLVVDDDDRFSYLLATLLRNRGYEVSTLHSAREALPLLMAEEIVSDLILCDVHMPGIDGGGFLAALRHAGFSTPAVILTSDEDVLLEAEMAALGADAFLQKREDPRILLAWIENLLKRPHSHDHA